MQDKNKSLGPGLLTGRLQNPAGELQAPQASIQLRLLANVKSEVGITSFIF